MTNAEQAYQGLKYAKNILNSISVVGVDNCRKLFIAHNNIDTFLNMIAGGQISIDCNTADTEENIKDTK